MRLTTDIFVTWLQEKIAATPYEHKFPVFSGRQPDDPDRCTSVFKTGPGEDAFDGTFEKLPFRLQTRGRSNSLSDAESLTLYLDDLLYSVHNVLIGPVYATEIYVLNKPMQLPTTDRQSRFQFLADYVVVASRFN